MNVNPHTWITANTSNTLEHFQYDENLTYQLPATSYKLTYATRHLFGRVGAHTFWRVVGQESPRPHERGGRGRAQIVGSPRARYRPRHRCEHACRSDEQSGAYGRACFVASAASSALTSRRGGVRLGRACGPYGVRVSRERKGKNSTRRRSGKDDRRFGRCHFAGTHGGGRQRARRSVGAHISGDFRPHREKVHVRIRPHARAVESRELGTPQARDGKRFCAIPV